MDAKCSREQLADRAVAVLLEMSVAGGAPRSITSFEPRSFTADDDVDQSPEAADLTPSAPPPDDAMVVVSSDDDASAASSAAAPVVDREELLDSRLAALLSLPAESLRPCVDTMVSILRRIAQAPDDPVVRRLKLANKAFQARVGCHTVALELLRMAGFQDSWEGAEAVITFRGDPATEEDFKGLFEALGDISEVLRAESPDAPSSSPCPGSRPPAGYPSGTPGARSGARP